ncbi:MAG TPA: hypothetical protein ENI23_07580 [bacterium]|nr:hypothetical protein [bacterium]
MAALSPRAAALYPKYDKDWFANRVAELEGLVSRTGTRLGEADGIILDLEAQVKRQTETIKECHERIAELATRIQEFKNVS